jgi:hypothetical protein
MRPIIRPFAGALLVVASLAIGACDGINLDLDELGLEIRGLNTVTVELVNDTGFDVDPYIRFDDDEGFLAQLFPADDLATGLLEPGDVLVFDFACDELGLIFSDGAEQLGVFGVIAQADDSTMLERGDDFECGDLIRFRFIGDFEQFGVLVSVNNVVVD